jgi:phosphate transport system permease protein
MLSMAVDLLASVPSIVMGLFGFVLILLLRRTFAPDATTCISLAAFCLALLVMPALVVTTRTSIESLPESLVITGTALGFTEHQLLRHILVPAAGKGILGGIMLAMGRAAEDTAVIMLTGVVVNSGLPAGLGSKFEALPFLIFYTAAQYVDQNELLRGFGAAMVLLVLSAGLLYAASRLQRTMEKRWRGAK